MLRITPACAGNSPYAKQAYRWQRLCTCTDGHIDMVHIGYCIGRNWWHQGVMSEALMMLIAFFLMRWVLTALRVVTIPEIPIQGW